MKNSKHLIVLAALLSAGSVSAEFDWNKALADVQERAKARWASTQETVRNASDGVKTWVREVAEEGREPMAEGMQTLDETFSSAVDSAFTGVDKMVEAVKSATDKVVTASKKAGAEFKEAATDLGKNVAETVATVSEDENTPSKVEALIDAVKTTYSDAQVWCVNHKKLVAIGAVALVTTGGATYVLYKNGTLAEWKNAVKAHPLRSVGITAVVVAATAGAWYATNHEVSLAPVKELCAKVANKLPFVVRS